ncbi:MAG: carboxypeptidase-like regulatory domain-containing protein, partial [Chitinophagaceae bacterium]
MHALEKAALEDPFLADALDGYAVPGVNVAEDLAALRQRLALATGQDKENKVIPMGAGGKPAVSWLRVAAMVVLLAGAGVLIYKFGFDNKKAEIAQSKVPQPSPVIAVPNTQLSPPPPADSIAATIPSGGNIVARKSAAPTHYHTWTTDSSSRNFAAAIPAAPASEAKEKLDGFFSDKSIDKKDLAKQAPNLNGYYDTVRTQFGIGMPLAKNNSDAESLRLRQPMKERMNAATAYQPGRTNIFRGRVTDAHNNALPFANITNTADNIGTYSDVKGNFVLTSPDSVLNVQVRSIGFENHTIQLNNSITSNQVTLQDDRSLGEVVISNRQNNSLSRSRNNTLVLEEPEPVDGWVNYDTYLANNLVVPETFRSRQAGGSVELSFEVNKDGEPVNITVERSLCDSCDKEAIRLLKEGP